MQSLTNLAMALDPVHMAEAAGIRLDEWQVQTVRSHSRRLAMNCSRQSGKTLAASVLAIHTAIYTPGSLTLYLSPSQRQSAEAFRSCISIYNALDSRVSASAETLLRLELANNSRVVALPGKEGTIRGYSNVDLLIIDEASRVEDSLYLSVLPMQAVSKNGRIVTLSSPWGARGWWWDAVLHHRSEWDYYEIPAEVCPRITAEFLEEAKATMGEWWFEQEFHCKFLDAQTAAFRSADLERIIQRDSEIWEF